MSAKKSNPAKRAPSKKKPSARASAIERIASTRRAPQKPKVPGSIKEISQGRFPGETPLTGEDRPQRGRGGKVKSRTLREKSAPARSGRERQRARRP